MSRQGVGIPHIFQFETALTCQRVCLGKPVEQCRVGDTGTRWSVGSSVQNEGLPGDKAGGTRGESFFLP